MWSACATWVQPPSVAWRRHATKLSTAPVCKAVHPSTLVETQGPSFVWVDAKGRLVQVTGSLRLSGHLPVAAQGTFPSLGLTRPVTTTDTLRLWDFGVPVHIEAPTDLLTHHASGGIIVPTSPVGRSRGGSVGVAVQRGIDDRGHSGSSSGR